MHPDPCHPDLLAWEPISGCFLFSDLVIQIKSMFEVFPNDASTNSKVFLGLGKKECAEQIDVMLNFIKNTDGSD